MEVNVAIFLLAKLLLKNNTYVTTFVFDSWVIRVYDIALRKEKVTEVVFLLLFFLH